MLLSIAPSSVYTQYDLPQRATFNFGSPSLYIPIALTIRKHVLNQGAIEKEASDSFSKCHRRTKNT